MSFQELAVAIGLLTPLVLGTLAFLEKFLHKKKDSDTTSLEVVQGMTVSPDPYADQLINALKNDLEETKRENEILRARLTERRSNG